MRALRYLAYSAAGAPGSGDSGAAEFSRAPAVIRELSDLEARLVTTVENQHRRDLSAYERAHDVVGVREALRAAGLPHTDRDLAPVYGLAASTIAGYRVIGERIDEGVLQRAGIVCDDTGRIDWDLVARIDKAALHRAAQLDATEDRVMAMRRIRARMVKQSGAAGERRRPRKRRGRSRRKGPRFSYQQLRERGDFSIRLTRPFREYSDADARRYLSDLAPAVAALAETVKGRDGAAAIPAGDGVVVYMDHVPDEDEAVAVREAAKRAREREPGSGEGGRG